MKRICICLIVLMGILSQLNAQEQLKKSTNIPRPNDAIFKQQVEYKNPGKSGKNVFWNFGELNAINKKYNIRYRSQGITADSIVGTEHQTNYYYHFHGDSLLLAGYENQTTVMNFFHPELLLRFPVTYGDSIGSYYYGTGKYCGKFDMRSCGSSKSVADSYGMLILPTGDTLCHVIRVHTLKLISEKTKFMSESDTLCSDSSVMDNLLIKAIQQCLANDSVTLMVDTYKWYAAGYRYPIFETVTTGNLRDNGKLPYFSTAFYYPPTDHEYLDNDEENKKIQERLRSEVSNNDENGNKDSKNPILDDLAFLYNFYPNPVHTTLEFEYYLSREAVICYELYTLSGMLFYKTNPEKIRGGAHEHQIDMSQYANGVYILRVRMNENIYSEKIIKK